MGARGKVLVRISRSEATTFARWIRKWVLPRLEKRNGTALGCGYNAKVMTDLCSLATTLEKAARRKRKSDVFSVLILKQVAKKVTTATTLCEPASPYGPGPMFQLDANIKSIAERFHLKGDVQRGRPRLSDLERKERIISKGLEERHRKRLKSALKADLAFDALIKAINARGETILTSTLT